MTRPEFAACMAYVAHAIGKPLAPDAAEVYWDLLNDLNTVVLCIAAKRVVLEHTWASFPLPAQFRAAAAETVRGDVNALSAAEAWRLAWHAAAHIDLEIAGSAERHLEDLPPLVVEAMQVFGLSALCCGKEPVGVIRAQFIKIYEQLAARDRRTALLPAGLKREIARIGQMPEEIRRIGLMPEEEQ